MAELEYSGQQYRTGKLSAMQQWEIFRRLGPVLPSLWSEFRDGVKHTPGARWIMGAVGGQLGELKQEDSDYILMTCLSVCEIYDSATQRWFRIAINGRIMYENTPLLVILELMDLAIQENLADFFAQLRSSASAEEEEGTAQMLMGLH